MPPGADRAVAREERLLSQDGAEGGRVVAGDKEGKGLPGQTAPGLVLRRHDAVVGRRVQAVGDLHLVAEVDLTQKNE